MIEEAEVGKRIQQYRRDKRLTLRELADKTGLTKGYLSKIEKAKRAPPVSTLINLSKAFRISVSEILGEGGDIKSAVSLVKKKDRPFIARDGTVFGYAYQTLSYKYPNRHMEPYILTLPLRPKQNALFQHNGEEMMFILEGTMRFFHGEREYIVEEGDCIYFDASIPHYGISQENREVKILMVIYSP